MATKPEKMQQALFARLVTLFPDEEDLDIVVSRFVAERVFTQTSAQVLTRDDLAQMSIPRGLAAQLHHAFTAPFATSAAFPAPAQAGGLDRLATTLEKAFAAKLEDLPVDQVIDRLISEGGSNPALVAFADGRHPDISRRGVVLVPGADKAIDKKATLDYLAQPLNYLGKRWVNQRVAKVADAFGVKIEYSPFALNRALQKGLDPETDLDLSQVDSMTRNFLVWVAQAKPQLVRDDGHGIVEALSEKGFVGMNPKSRFAKVVVEYEEACSENPGLATQYLAQLYRAPSADAPEGAPDGRPFVGEPSPAHAAPEKPSMAEESEFQKAVTFQRYYTALMSAYPNWAGLERALRFELDLNLNTISSPQHGMDTVIMNLVTWARSQGQMLALFRALRRGNATNALLAALEVDAYNAIWSRQRITQLRNVLAQTYPNRADARIFASDVGLPTDSIDFDGSSNDFWHSVLDKAGNHGMLDACLRRAKREYPAALTRAGF